MLSSKIFSGAREHSPDREGMIETLTTSLKKLSWRLSSEERRLLSSCLSTIYASSMAAQGFAAAAVDSARSPSMSRSVKDNLLEQLSLLLEEIQDLSNLTGELSWAMWLSEDETP